MGMFDYVHYRCPNCERDIEDQSKSGPCILSSYNLDNVPASVAEGICGQQTCGYCGKDYIIEMVNKPTYRIIPASTAGKIDDRT